MINESENERRESLKLDFKYSNNCNEEDQKIFDNIDKEEDMKAPEITKILEKYLKDKGFLTIRERNYVGYNEAPFDLTAGDENSLKLYGFEIKSDKDTFERLHKQLQHYSFICQEVWLVLHKKEIPKWLPSWVGVIRITKGKKIFMERHSFEKEPFEISTGYAWDKIAKENAIAGSKKNLQELFNDLISIRKNILFNQYFAIQYNSSTNNSEFKKFFPLNDKQKRFICGLNVKYQMKELNKDLKKLEKRFEMIKQIMNVKDSEKQLKLKKKK